MNYSQDQILQLAPDDASKKAGLQLANSAKWLIKNCHEKALWGDCQGSGSKPYKTIIDLQNLAFKCSCPSRKFPCKHGLGLFLLYASQQNIFTKVNELDEAIADWINKREAKAEAKEKPKEDKPVDEKAQQKRIEAREKKIDAGIEELNIWLKDTVRNGIMNVPQSPYQFNQNISTRMIDAQATGLANQLRKINSISFYEEGWQFKLSKQLSLIHFICDAYKNKLSFDDIWQKELNTQIGWTITKDEVLNQLSYIDNWVILSKTEEDDGNLTLEKIYLFGKQNKQFALLLNFYAGNQLPENIYSVGSSIHAEICYYPGANSIRAIIKNQTQISNEFNEIIGILSVDNLLEQISNQIAANPFSKVIPFVLSNFKIVTDEKNWYLKDADQFIYPLKNTADECWNILSISQANSFSCFVIYEEYTIMVHSLWLNDKFYSIK